MYSDGASIIIHNDEANRNAYRYADGMSIERSYPFIRTRLERFLGEDETRIYGWAEHEDEIGILVRPVEAVIDQRVLWLLIMDVIHFNIIPNHPEDTVLPGVHDFYVRLQNDRFVYVHAWITVNLILDWLDNLPQAGVWYEEDALEWEAQTLVAEEDALEQLELEYTQRAFVELEL